MNERLKQKRTKELIEKISQTLSKIRGDWQHWMSGHCMQFVERGVQTSRASCMEDTHKGRWQCSKGDTRLLEMWIAFF